MASKKVDRIGPLWQRVDQKVTISKNAVYTQESTDGNALTAYLYDEDTADPVRAGGLNVTFGSPVGEAEDTDIVMYIDTLTDITLTDATWYELVIKDDDGNVLLPNRVTANRVLIQLFPQPS